MSVTTVQNDISVLLYHCYSMQSACDLVGQEADVERALPAHQLVTLRLKSCISDTHLPFI